MTRIVLRRWHIGTSLAVVVMFSGAAATLEASANVRDNLRRTIVGGGVADPDRYPYYVRLDYDGYVGCGATLVARDLILTAAHCVHDEDLDTSSIVAVRTASGETEERTVVRLFPHPAYDDPSNRYDVAIVQMNEPFTSATFVQLATTNHSEWASQQQLSTNVTVIGFGVTAEDAEVSDVLREAELQVVPDKACQDGYHGDSIHPPSMMCAAPTNNRQGPCYRDSGGPLLLFGDQDDFENDLQVGIVSFGGDVCAHPRQPSVYVDVANVESWVRRVICQFSTMRPTELNCQVNSLVGSTTDDEPIIIVVDDSTSGAPTTFTSKRRPYILEMVIVLALIVFY